MRSTWTSNMKTHMRRAIMHQAAMKRIGISPMSTHKLNENITIKMNSNKDSMLKDDQDNIQAKESTLRQQDI